MSPSNNSIGPPLCRLLQWGAHPEVLEGTFVDKEEELEQQTNEISFSNVYSLWGEGVPSADSLDDDESINIAAPPIDSVTQLWQQTGIDHDDIDNDNEELDVSAYANFEWWDQVTEDGGSLRESRRPDISGGLRLRA